MSTAPDFLCIGFFCHDLHQSQYILGGTAAYCSLMAANLHQKTAVLTSVGADFQFFSQFEQANVTIHNKEAAHTTLFENIYQDQIRTQYIHQRAETLYLQDLPDSFQKARIVKFCLIADEVDYALLKAFPEALVGASIQGWLRQWDQNGKVSPKAMDWEQLANIDVALMSKDDLIGFEEFIPKIASLVDVLVITNGGEDTLIYHAEEIHSFPCFPVEEVDPTGAGDIFAVAFLIRFAQTSSIQKAVAYAHVAASFVVEGIGVSLPSQNDIDQRLLEYERLFSKP